MNNLMIIKKKAIFVFVLCFLFFDIVDMNGQTVRLTKDLDDGSLEPALCVQENSEIYFPIWNFHKYPILVSNINISSNPHNPVTNISSSSFTILSGDSYDVSSTHAYLWIAGSLVEATISFDYEILSPEPVSMQFNGTVDFQICEPQPDLETDNEERKASLVKTSIQIYPNPTSENFQIDYSLQEETLVDIALYDNLGRKVKSIVNNENQLEGQYTLDESFPSDLSTGIYYIISNIEGNISSKKLVKL